MDTPAISIIVPTYKEAENLSVLVGRIESVKKNHNLNIELLVIDDNSGDGVEEVVESLEKAWVKLYIRTEKRSLSRSVCQGLATASHDIFVVMDADLSHPPEVIPELIAVLMSGCDFALGSRYVDGGSTSHDWGFLRWLNSRVATMLASPFTAVKDLMSGFFAIPKTIYQRAEALNPVGYKIGLELMVKCGCERIREVPIHFENRKFGESKLTLKEQLKYVQHICRLLAYKYPGSVVVARGGMLWALGLGGYLSLLAMLFLLGFSSQAALAVAIVSATIIQVALRRDRTVSAGQHGSVIKGGARLWRLHIISIVLNYGATMALLALNPLMSPLKAAAVGFLASNLTQVLIHQYHAFKLKYYRG